MQHPDETRWYLCRARAQSPFGLRGSRIFVSHYSPRTDRKPVGVYEALIAPYLHHPLPSVRASCKSARTAPVQLRTPEAQAARTAAQGASHSRNPHHTAGSLSKRPRSARHTGSSRVHGANRLAVRISAIQKACRLVEVVAFEIVKVGV